MHPLSPGYRTDRKRKCIPITCHRLKYHESCDCSRGSNLNTVSDPGATTPTVTTTTSNDSGTQNYAFKNYSREVFSIPLFECISNAL